MKKSLTIILLALTLNMSAESRDSLQIYKDSVACLNYNLFKAEEFVDKKLHDYFESCNEKEKSALMPLIISLDKSNWQGVRIVNKIDALLNLMSIKMKEEK